MDRTWEYAQAVERRGGSTAPRRAATDTNQHRTVAFKSCVEVLRRKMQEVERNVDQVVRGTSSSRFQGSKTHKEYERERERTRDELREWHRALEQLQWDANGLAERLRPTERAHVQGMLLIESERLADATKRFDRACSKSTRRRHLRRPAARAINHDLDSQRNNYEESNVNNEQKSSPGVLGTELVATTANQESSALLDDLEMAKEAHRAMVEISSLHHLFSTEVQRQTHQIETMYEDAVSATQNFEVANIHLQKTVERTSGSTMHVLLFFIIVSFALLFLDWLSG